MSCPDLTYERARGLHLDASFHAAFQGEVYAQPLFWRPPGSGAGVLIVATEEDEVYALDAKSGAQIWKRTLGVPVPRSALPCGNISPLGVTGAPVIDEARATLYLDAAVMRANGPRHEIYALSLADGSIEPGWPLDVATALSGSFAPVIAEPARRVGGVRRARSSFRSAGIGAIAAPITGLLSAFPRASRARPRASRREREAAAYGRRAASAGDGKSLFAATGNTFRASSWSDGEAVLRLGPDLARPDDARDYFAPSDWRDLDCQDLDLGGTAPTPLDVASANGARKLIFAIGKTGVAYLLDRDNLGGIGGALASARVTTNIAIASPAVWSAGDGVFVALQGDGARCPPTSRGKD